MIWGARTIGDAILAGRSIISTHHGSNFWHKFLRILDRDRQVWPLVYSLWIGCCCWLSLRLRNGLGRSAVHMSSEFLPLEGANSWARKASSTSMAPLHSETDGSVQTGPQQVRGSLKSSILYLVFWMILQGHIHSSSPVNRLRLMRFKRPSRIQLLVATQMLLGTRCS